MAHLPDIDQLLNECRFDATRSGGKGGQNVNKVATKVILILDISASQVLSDEQKIVFLSELHTRISRQNIFRISSSVERTQSGNRRRVEEKFRLLVIKAFETQEERIATKPTYSSKMKRLQTKKENSDRKTSRNQNWTETE